MTLRCGLAWCCALFLVGCGDGALLTSDSGSPPCTSAIDCNDGVFCNGVEQCAPSSPDADDRGCVPADATPCELSQVCDELRSRCVTVCATDADADGDGVNAIECGGADCDDSDADRFPGNPERCDDEGHDEDCDPTTFGDTDVDGDGVVSDACCNGETCGRDCDDSDDAVRPGQTELCNGADTDCDGRIDEGVSRLFFPDLDGDGYGDRTGQPVWRCGLEVGLAENALDCDDARSEAAPGRNEVCDGTVDQDCDGTVDEMLAVSIECQNRFGSPSLTSYACTEAGACVVGTCALGFADCDDDPSTGCETNLNTSATHCGTCGRSCGAGGVCTDGVCDRVVDVEAGTNFTCARRERADGTPTGVVCWGNNEFGQLGDGSTMGRLTPVPVAGVRDATVIALSGHESRTSSPFACALASGIVQCWGSNDRGQLGRGTLGSVGLTPAPVTGTPKVVAYYDQPFRGRHVALSVGMEHACVLEDTGVPSPGGTPSSYPFELRCWGGNTTQQIQPGGLPRPDYPTATTTLRTTRYPPPFSLASATSFESCMVESGNHVRCRGGGSDSSSTLSSAPARLAFFQETLMALMADGTIQVVGYPDSTFTLADGSPLPAVAQLSASSNEGGGRACVRFHDGTVACMAHFTAPGFAYVSGIDDAVDLAVGPRHACVLRSSGGVFCWGANGDGQCGTGTTTPVAVPTRVVDL